MSDQTTPKYKCLACKNHIKDWAGPDSTCAFETGVFSTNNWRCATLLAFNRYVRWAVKTQPLVNITLCDTQQNYATINLEDIDLPGWSDAGYPVCLVVVWRKNHGRTDQMWLIYDSLPPRPPTEKELLTITAALENDHGHA